MIQQKSATSKIKSIDRWLDEQEQAVISNGAVAAESNIGGQLQKQMVVN